MNRSESRGAMRAVQHATAAALLGLLCALVAMPAVAQRRVDPSPATSSTLPAWEQLTPAQREQLIAPMRQRWNANPAQRARMLNHAQRWQQLTPEQRRHANRGRDRLQDMTPAQREEARAAFQRMRALPEPERKVLRERLRTMTPEQRREWMRLQGRTPPRN